MSVLKRFYFKRFYLKWLYYLWTLVRNVKNFWPLLTISNFEKSDNFLTLELNAFTVKAVNHFPIIVENFKYLTGKSTMKISKYRGEFSLECIRPGLVAIISQHLRWWIVEMIHSEIIPRKHLLHYSFQKGVRPLSSQWFLKISSKMYKQCFQLCVLSLNHCIASILAFGLLYGFNINVNVQCFWIEMH